MDRLFGVPGLCPCGHESAPAKPYMKPFIARMCGDCRTTYWRVKDRKRRGKPAVPDADYQPPCEGCGAELVRDSSHPKRLCGDCKVKSWTKRDGYGRCIECQRPKETLNNRRCDECREQFRKARDRRKNVKRRAAQDSGGDLYTLIEIAERDGWVCHLCERKVPKRSPKGYHPKKATIDHLVPISDGGRDVRENVRLAHWRCNSARGARGTVQLLLIG